MERYEAYKDSGVEWIGEIPESWTVQRFRWTLKRVNRQPLESDEIVTCFRDGEVTLRKNRREDGFTMSDKEIGYQHICTGDFVIHGMDGFAGAMGISDSDGKASPVLMAFRPVGSQELRFINYLLRLYAWRNVFLALSTTIRVRSCDLNWAKVAPLPLTLPSFKEQQAIADYLDAKTAEIDGLVADCEREVDLLREYRKAVISEAVTKGLDPDAPMKDSGIEWIGEIPEDWEVARLDKVAIRKSGHTPDKKVPEYWDGDIVWISLADSPRLRTNAFVNESNSMTTEAGIANSSAELLPVGAVLLSRDASVGLTAIAGVQLAVSQHFMAYICGDNLNNEYLRYVFLAMHQEFEKLSMGSTIPTIGLPLMRRLTIPFPSRDMQDEIVCYLNRRVKDIDSLISDNESIANKLREYRKSLISEAVTGKFKVPGV